MREEECIVGTRVRIKEHSKSGRSWPNMKIYEGATGTLDASDHVMYDDPGLQQQQEIEHGWYWYTEDFIKLED